MTVWPSPILNPPCEAFRGAGTRRAYAHPWSSAKPALPAALAVARGIPESKSDENHP